MTDNYKFPENVFDHFFENSIDLLCIADTNGYFIKLNHEWELTLGYKTSELEGKPFIEYVHPEDVEDTVNATRELANNQRVHNFKNRYRHKNGTYRWIEWRSFPSAGLIFATARDITEHINAQEELRKTNLWLRESQRNSHIGSYNLDFTTGQWKSSEELDLIFGITADYDKSVEGWVNIIHPDHKQDMTTHFFEHVLKTHQQFNNVYRIIRQNDGEIRWVHGLGNLLFNKKGDLIQMIGTIQDITDIKNAQEALKVSEERNRLINSLTTDYIFIVKVDENNNLQIEYVSENYEILTGRKMDEVKDLSSWFTIFHQEDYPKLLSFIQHVLTTAQGGELECRTFARGIIRWINIVVKPEVDPSSGKVAKIFGAVKDISFKKEIEIQLRSSEDKFSAAFKTSPDAISINRLSDGLFIEINNGFKTITGYNENDIKGKSTLDINIWINLNERKKLLVSLKRHGIVTNFETNLRCKDGSNFYGLMSASQITVQGEPCILSVTKNISERRHAEEKIKENEEKFRIAFENAPYGMSMIRPNGQYVDINPMLCEMFGYPKDELLSGTINKITHPDDIERSYEWIKKMIAGDMSEPEFEKRYIHKDGHIIWGLVRSQWIRNEDGSPRMSVTHIMDITKRKQVEEELIRAKEKAELSDKLKDAFLQNLSHEIRTPLNAIVGFSDLLSSDNSQDVSEDIKNYSAIIKRSSNQLLSIVTDILTMSSIQTGQEKIVSEPFDVHKLFSDLEEIYSFKASNKQITLRVIKENPCNVFHILTDGTKLTQIITNLLDNSIKYTHDGFIELKYAIKDKFIEFSVADTGIGIAKEAHEFIFERFRQAEQSIHARYGGTGLGLSISGSFAKMLGGSICVESELGKGSAFKVQIPYESFEEVVRKKSITEAKVNIAVTTILVAEDEINNFLLIKEILKELDIHRLMHARDGSEAVQMCESNPDIDLVLMDIKMPGMDGITAFKEIQKFRKQMPVIAQTAYALEKDECEFLKMGFIDYISKPIKREELLAKINKVVIPSD